MSRVEITGFGRSVVVDADVSLDKVKAAALDIYTRTHDPDMARGFGVTGLLLERTDGTDTEVSCG